MKEEGRTSRMHAQVSEMSKEYLSGNLLEKDVWKV
jgi:hypothetical protein